MRKQQSGFTLIELMIVVAIVGILASVAIPAYSDYTIRAKVSEAVTAVAPVKASVADYYYGNGDLPTSSADAGLDGTSGGAEGLSGGNYSTEVVESILVQADPAGSISVTLNDIGNEELQGKNILFKPSVGTNGQITWSCEAGTAAATLPARFAPASCRGSST